MSSFIAGDEHFYQVRNEDNITFLIGLLLRHRFFQAILLDGVTSNSGSACTGGGGNPQNQESLC